MQSVTSATIVATTARANDTTLFASLELSKSKWVVTINNPGSEKFSNRKPLRHCSGARRTRRPSRGWGIGQSFHSGLYPGATETFVVESR